ncbi:MAG TPA: DUF2059 domain-containing protein [Longimicrobium sp.]|jgi:hypothetical protein
MRKRLLVLGFALALAAPAAAQQTPARTFAPSHMAAAREFLDAVQIQKLTAAGTEATISEQIRANPEMARYREAMLGWARDLFSSEEAVTAFAELYAEAFTEADLRALTAFYQTPLGQRLAANQTVLAGRGAELGRRLAESKQADLVARIQRVDAKP